ncbi:MAG: HD domain-containing protein [Limnobacter sp.]|uniref:HD domain-containing protein n=1 Tax=Limnobacter sp. TaxID=2003368 RepID=UPI0039199EB9
MKPQNRSTDRATTQFSVNKNPRHVDVAERIRAAFLAQNPRHHFEVATPKLLGGGQVINQGCVYRENQLSKHAQVKNGQAFTVGAYGEILTIENRLVPHFDKTKELTKQYARVGVPLYCAKTYGLIDHAQLSMNWVLKDREWEQGEMIRLSDVDVLGPHGVGLRRVWSTPQASYLPADTNPFDYAGLGMPVYLRALVGGCSEHNAVNLSDVCAFLSAVINHLNPEDRSLFLAVVGQESRWNKFLTYPASLRSHHNYERGLLVHTAEVVAYVLLDLANLKEPADVSLTILAALLHDFGKVEDYIRLTEGAYIGNQNCQLIGHEQTMLKWISGACQCEVTYPKERQLALEHAICAVKRQHDQSGVRKRKTIESFLLHDADCQSARADSLKRTSILIEAGLVSAKQYAGV